MVHANACFDSRGFAPLAVFLTPLQGYALSREGAFAGLKCADEHPASFQFAFIRGVLIECD